MLEQTIFLVELFLVSTFVTLNKSFSLLIIPGIFVTLLLHRCFEQNGPFSLLIISGILVTSLLDSCFEQNCFFVTSAQLLGPVVQSIVCLTSLLRVISLTVLADSIYSILIFFAEKM